HSMKPNRRTGHGSPICTCGWPASPQRPIALALPPTYRYSLAGFRTRRRRGDSMLRKWLTFAALFAAGAVVWNEYRLWTHRFQPAPLQVAMPSARLEPVREAIATESFQAAVNRLAAGEEESDATIIDLTLLQRQTIEPA